MHFSFILVEASLIPLEGQKGERVSIKRLTFGVNEGREMTRSSDAPFRLQLKGSASLSGHRSPHGSEMFSARSNLSLTLLSFHFLIPSSRIGKETGDDTYGQSNVEA